MGGGFCPNSFLHMAGGTGARSVQQALARLLNDSRIRNVVFVNIVRGRLSHARSRQAPPGGLRGWTDGMIATGRFLTGVDIRFPLGALGLGPWTA